MGTRCEIVDVIHHLSPKVPIIFLSYYGLDVEISLKNPQANNRAESIFIPLSTILGTNGDKWGLMETIGD